MPERSATLSGSHSQCAASDQIIFRSFHFAQIAFIVASACLRAFSGVSAPVAASANIVLIDPGVEGLVDRRVGVAGIADIRRPIEHVGKHRVLVVRHGLRIIGDDLFQVGNGLAKQGKL